MKKFFWPAIICGAIFSTIPAAATPTTYSFNFTNQASNSDLSSFTATSNGVTATAVAFYATGSSSGPASDLMSAEVGEYNGAGAGICENQSSDNCSSPNHQIDNGADTTLSGGNGSGADNFEFMLVQFSAAVDLSSITLGNFGDTNGNSNPFNSTYFTSTSSSSINAMETALEATTLSSLTGTGFGGSESQEGCTTGATTATATNNASCAEDATGINENLAGTAVTYLLIGASIQNNQAGTDFFKIQDLDASQYSRSGQGATPEPATFALLGLALTGLGIYGRKRKSSN